MQVTRARERNRLNITNINTRMPADIADLVTDTGVRDVTAYVMRVVK